MAYIGKSPTGTGVRQRYYFTATGGETSLSGADDNGLTLSYSDGAYVDVLLNGIELVAGTDYNTTTANTIAGLSALAASDVVTVTVYDIFTVADTVSAKDGGTFSGNVNINGDLDINGNDLILDADADSKIEASTDDTINIISGGTTGLTVDSSGRVLTPVRPAFFARSTASIFRTVAEIAQYNDVSGTGCFNEGGHYSTTTYKFTAPVNGLYSFAAQFYSNNETTSVMYFMIDSSQVAGSQVNGINDQSAYEGIEMAVTLKLTANQTVYIMSASGGYHLNYSLSYFCGHLIG
jgi:hypothetical protein